MYKERPLSWKLFSIIMIGFFCATFSAPMGDFYLIASKLKNLSLKF